VRVASACIGPAASCFLATQYSRRRHGGAAAHAAIRSAHPANLPDDLDRLANRRALATALSLAGLAALSGSRPCIRSATPWRKMRRRHWWPSGVAARYGARAGKGAGHHHEYASMSCPHCAAFDENVFPMLKSKYIDTGKVRFVFREFRSTSRPLRPRCWRAASPMTMPGNFSAPSIRCSNSRIS